MRNYSPLLASGVLLRSPMALAGALCTSRALYSIPGKVKVCVRTRDGATCDFEAPVGMSLMHAIRDVAKLEMDGACDGCAQCSTCHVYLSEASVKKLGSPSEREQDTLDRALDLQDTSRLACQITITPSMNGLEVVLPKNVTNLLM
ncbi:adrenodoxin-like protein [Leishmania mexicana MHOM/GT/2001/U1103]|uniref:Adrenodoxin-like protein n=1 Tax=Leishmania mexicana (strain MHOM/GT/2001/U1103) TaxID=929439 RepID=E9B249_LEIMU|nr:adrenodoxin-like protein [Leishmania mexicana MHOM/GT/2001/U1103]CBZ29308.1 adrenodoxin-like protein [Leishmania mexicana MHOM/GT/2001/U1103]